MRSDRQNVGEHDQEAGNVYITHPSSVFRFLSFVFSGLSSAVCRPSSAIRHLSSPVSRLSSVVRRPSSLFTLLRTGIRRLSSGFRLSSVFSGLSSVVRRLSSGFTLVELMVVVAVIAILLMLLVPNIRTMREKAWSSNCQNNLRQYGVAMNQYMADYSGYFIYPGFGVGGGVDGSSLGGSDVSWTAFKRGPVRGATVGGAAPDYWQNMIPNYIGAQVTLATLSAGEPSVRVCPVVLRDLYTANYFDPKSPNFKGYRLEIDPDGIWFPRYVGDFEDSGGAGYDDLYGELLPDYTSKYLDSAFTTYAINQQKIYNNKKNIPENVVAFIDWNAREGWWAVLSYTTWMFTGTNAAGVVVNQGDSKLALKGTTDWWLTEVGFHHLQGNIYGANYVAMDGHVGWIGSNTISQTNFTTGL